uniref:Arrestin-like N-terminal domain-containing protein n=1 Tax=Sinocyclocheilus rhinocerous TaxID=307959 RepID=A0A673IE47_9TELE
MGKLQEFEITFTNNKVVYNPGESISGTVRIKTSQSLQFKGTLPAGEHSFPFQFLIPGKQMRRYRDKAS